jgi:hypothetical protein
MTVHARKKQAIELKIVAPRRQLGPLQMWAWWLLFSKPRFTRGHLHNWPGGGWLLNARQPNGGYSTIPARTRLGCWWRLLRNRNGMGWSVRW